MQKGRSRGAAHDNKLAFGEFGLMTTQPGWILGKSRPPESP